MPKSEFTPGPWNSKAIPGHLFEITDAKGNPVFRVRGGVMPTLCDARLIAAAPDLLTAAEECLADLEHYVATHGPGPDKRLAALITAIAKARNG